MPVPDTTSSSNSPTPTSARPSAADALRRCSIEIASESSPESTTLALLAVVEGLMYECLSQDSMRLALYRGKNSAIQAGVPEPEARRVTEALWELYRSRRSMNPLSGMF